MDPTDFYEFLLFSGNVEGKLNNDILLINIPVLKDVQENLLYLFPTHANSHWIQSKFSRWRKYKVEKRIFDLANSIVIKAWRIMGIKEFTCKMCGAIHCM